MEMAGVGAVRYSATISAAGMLVPFEGGYRIIVKADQPAARQRWTVAHEIAHTFIPYPEHELAAPEFAELERRCDLFAEALLLPAKDVRGAFRGFLDAGPIAALLSVASEYGVSTEAALNRAHDLGVLNGSRSLLAAIESGGAQSWRIRKVAADRRLGLGDCVGYGIEEIGLPDSTIGSVELGIVVEHEMSGLVMGNDTGERSVRSGLIGVLRQNETTALVSFRPRR